MNDAEFDRLMEQARLEYRLHGVVFITTVSRLAELGVEVDSVLTQIENEETL